MDNLQMVGIVMLVGAPMIWLMLRRRSARRLDFRIIGRLAPLAERQFRWDTLSSREMQVARLAVAGKRNRDIARDLDIKVNTVETHMKNIYRKLDVHTRVELARNIRDLLD